MGISQNFLFTDSIFKKSVYESVVWGSQSILGLSSSHPGDTKSFLIVSNCPTRLATLHSLLSNF